MSLIQIKPFKYYIGREDELKEINNRNIFIHPYKVKPITDPIIYEEPISNEFWNLDIIDYPQIEEDIMIDIEKINY